MNEPPDKPARSLWDVLRRTGQVRRSSAETEPDPLADDDDQSMSSPRSLWEVMGDGPTASRSAELADPSVQPHGATEQSVPSENVGGESADDGFLPVSQTSSKPISAPPGEPVTSVCSRRAMLSLTMGLLSLPTAVLAVFDNVVWNLPALVLGFGAVLAGLAALGEIRRSRGEQTGRGLALAGILLGAVGMFLGPTLFADARQRVVRNPDPKTHSRFDFATPVADNQCFLPIGLLRHTMSSEAKTKSEHAYGLWSIFIRPVGRSGNKSPSERIRLTG